MFGFIKIEYPPRTGTSIVASENDEVMDSLDGDTFSVNVPDDEITRVYDGEDVDFHFSFAFDPSYVIDKTYQEWAASRRRAKSRKNTGNVLEDGLSEEEYEEAGDDSEDGVETDVVNDEVEIPDDVKDMLLRVNLTLNDARKLARRRTKVGTALALACQEAGLTTTEYRVIYFYVIDD